MLSLIAHYALHIAAGLIVAALVLVVAIEVRHAKAEERRRSHWRSPR